MPQIGGLKQISYLTVLVVRSPKIKMSAELQYFWGLPGRQFPYLFWLVEIASSSWLMVSFFIFKRSSIAYPHLSSSAFLL